MQGVGREAGNREDMRREKKRTIITRCLGGVLAAVLIFGQLAATAEAAQVNEKGRTATVISHEEEAKATVEETMIGSDAWETPLIPNAAAEIPGVSEHKISLNETTGDGTWKFLFDIPDYTEPNGVPAPFEKEQEFNFDAWSDRNWENIKVPGEALMQGFDILTNNEYYYQREITIPEDFAENRIMVRFDGVYSNARVWIDGEYIRTHTGGFTTWDCDITEYASPGQTVTMTVGVADIYSDTKGIWNPKGEMLNNPSNATEYAHHNIGGILRDVSLIALPSDYIARTYVKTEFDENFVNADLEVTAQLGMVSRKAQLLVELLDGGNVVKAGEMEFEQAEGGMSKALKLTLPVEQPKQWDAEHPNLYTLRTTLYINDKRVQVNEEKIGFREIHYGGREGTDGNKVYVNGNEVKLRGTCRHDVSDDLGRSMTRDEMYAEAAAYKNANINFIRTSHYPASEALLDACDEMGIYVEQETAVCFQGYGTFGSNVYSKYEDYLPQFTEMIERDQNRASILIWSLGNESNYSNVANQSGGNAFQTEKEYLSDVDTTRPCIFSWPDTGEPWDLADIYSKHYADIQGNVGSGSKPILHDEYAHISCYNIDELQRDVNVRNFWGESVLKAWENIFTSDGALGGALWGGIDDVFYIPEGTTERWQSHSDGPAAGYGEWGSVLDAYLREKPEAYLTKKAYSPVRVDEVSCSVTDGTLNIPVKNWFDHTDMNELELEYTVDGETQRIQIAESILPHGEGVVTAPGISSNARVVNLKFYTADGIMVDEYNVELAKVKYSFTPASAHAPELQVTEKDITVKGEGFSLIFGKSVGMITEGTLDETQGKILTGGPFLHVTGAELGAWIPDGKHGISAETVGSHVEVTMKGRYENGPDVVFNMQISGNGIINTTYTLTSVPPVGWGLQEVGISYGISSDMNSVSWFRDGLYSAYPEDHIGRNQGVALKERQSEGIQDQYGAEPSWPWKDDMSNYFVYAENDPNSSLATNDFRTMRENVYHYNVNYGVGENVPHISVESVDRSAAARVNLAYERNYIDDRDSSILYSAGWDTYESSFDYGGTETYSTDVGESCEFTFEGTGVRYIGSRQKNTGKVEIYIDGEFKTEVDTYSDLGNELKQSVIYSINGLENGSHTIRLVTSGGNADCIVVDAFEVLNQEDSRSAVNAELIINNQWYYPNLAWGNYTGHAGSLYSGSTGKAIVRLSAEENFSTDVVPVIANVAAEETGDHMLEVTYDLRNAGEGSTVKFQWYRTAVGDPDSKTRRIEGANTSILNIGGMEADRIYCEVSLETDGKETEPVKSNAVEIGTDCYQYHDVLEDSEEFLFRGTKGLDYQTDRNERWTENAYKKTVTYLNDTENPAETSFTFNGSKIRWIGAKEVNQGIAEVDIDGETIGEIDLYGENIESGYQVNEILFEQSFEAAGEHTITIRRTGRKNPDAAGAAVNIDAFIVIDNGVQDPDIPSVDKTALRLAVAMAEKLEAQQSAQQSFTEDSWAATQEALDSARAIMENQDASLEDTEHAFLNLITACNLLENGVQKMGLKAAIEGTEAILADEKGLTGYTEESVEAVRTKLAEARRIYAESGANQEAVNASSRKLMDAVTALLVTEADTRLEILIQKAVELQKNRGQYTDSSMRNLDTAMEAAKAAAGNSQADEGEISEAYNSLAEAITTLVRRGNKEELKNAIAKAHEILNSMDRYLEQSIAGLQEVRNEAQAVYESGDADADTVAGVLKKIINEILKARLMGDVNHDGTVDTEDSAEILRDAAELVTLSQEQRMAADVSRNGSADTEDAAEILRFAAEVMTGF